MTNIAVNQTGRPGGHRVQAPQTIDFLVAKNLVRAVVRNCHTSPFAEILAYSFRAAESPVFVRPSPRVGSQLFPLQERCQLPAWGKAINYGLRSAASTAVVVLGRLRSWHSKLRH